MANKYFVGGGFSGGQGGFNSFNGGYPGGFGPGYGGFNGGYPGGDFGPGYGGGRFHNRYRRRLFGR